MKNKFKNNIVRSFRRYNVLGLKYKKNIYLLLWFYHSFLTIKNIMYNFFRPIQSVIVNYETLVRNAKVKSD